MSGMEYAAIQPGDLSPGAMNVDTEASSNGGASNSSAGIAAAQQEEEKKEAAPADRRAQLLQQLKATKD